MADNTTIQSMTGGDVIATDDLTTLNGGAVSGFKIQRVKPSYGSDASARDVDTSNPLPVGLMQGGNVQSVKATGGALVDIEPVAFTATTGSITASAQTVSASVANAGSVTISISGTYAGINLSFEASDDGGTTWYPIMAQRSDSYVTELTTGVLPTNQSRMWDIPAPGITNIRVRSTAFTSGTGAIRITPASMSFEVAPSIGPANDLVTASGSMAALNAAVTLTGLQGVSTVAVIVGGASTATATLEGSGDGTTWVIIPFIVANSTISANPGNNLKTSINANLNPTMIANVAGFTQVRVRLSAYTSGTATGIVRASVGQFSPLAFYGTNTDANSWAGNTGDGWPLTGTVNYYYNGSSFDRMRGSTNGMFTQGAAASGATVAGNPVLSGGRAASASPTAVTGGQAVAKMLDLLGRMVTSPYSNPENYVHGVLTLTTTTSTALLAAAGAGIRNYVTSFGASNTSATAVRIDFLDGATVKYSYFIAASGGGVSRELPVPFKGTANTAFNAQLSAAVTDVRTDCDGYTQP